MHKFGEGFETLTAPTYSPTLKKVIRLTTLDAENEDTENIILFHTLRSEGHQCVRQDDPSPIKPSKFIADKKRANVSAIYDVLWKTDLECTIACQFHF